MRLVDLGVLYAGIGVACAVTLYRRAPVRNREALATALMAVPQGTDTQLRTSSSQTARS